jgi:hypothetical protein
VTAGLAGVAERLMKALLITTSSGPASSNRRAATLMQSPIAPMCMRLKGRSETIWSNPLFKMAGEQANLTPDRSRV